MKRRVILVAAGVLAAGLAGYFLMMPWERVEAPVVQEETAPAAGAQGARTRGAVVIGADGLLAVSLHVKDAGLEEVVAALNEQLSVPIGARQVALPRGSVGGGDYTYSLDVTNRTFWEIVGMMDDQCLMNVHEMRGAISLDENARSVGAHAISGPFFLEVFERPITQSRPPSLGMQYVFLADPRLKVASVSYAITTQTLRRGGQVGRSTFVTPLNGYTKTGEATGAGATGSMQHQWEPDITDVKTVVTASAVYKMESGEEKKAEFRLEVGQPEH